jgi:hypothetical protein
MNKLFYAVTIVVLALALGAAYVVTSGDSPDQTPTAAQPVAPQPTSQDFKNFKIP